jgi:hypothetical protein
VIQKGVSFPAGGGRVLKSASVMLQKEKAALETKAAFF